MACSYSQIESDTLNRYDSKHNKIGYWVTYFGERLCQVKDKSEAYYYTYIYWDSGYSIDGLFCPHACKSRSRGAKFESSNPGTIKGQPILLNGTFIVYNEFGKMIMYESYLQGKPQIIKDFSYDKSGQCKSETIIDYTRNYKNQPASFLYIYKKANGAVSDSSLFGKNEKGKWVTIR